MNGTFRFLVAGFASTLLLAQGTQTAFASLNAEPAPAVQAQSIVPPSENGEFPFFDDQAWDVQRKGLAMKAASRLLIEEPGSPVTFQLLSALHRYEEAMEVLRHILENHPDRIAAALAPLPGRPFLSTDESSHTFPFPDFAIPLRMLVAQVHERLPQMAQGEALRTARSVLPLANELARGGNRDLAADFTDFIAKHAAGEDALHDEVSRLSSARASPESLKVLEDFARKHPGTVAGARALYDMAIDRIHNGVHVGFEPIRGDPTERFMRIVQIVRELESGEYPPCEWIEKAPKLVVEFFVYEPSYAAGNAERMLKAFEEFLVTHFKLNQQDPDESPIIGVLTVQMFGLFNLSGEGIAGVERVFTKLEQQSSQPAGVQLLKARFYIELMRETSGDGRTQLLNKARQTLQATHDQSDGLHQRLALATLASVYFHERDYANALGSYRRYLTFYPRSDWASVAALRVGQCHEKLNDLAAADNAFRAAVETYRSVPVAAVLGNTYASSTAEALGRANDALRAAKQALEGWDNDCGQWYDVRAIQARPETDAPFAIGEPTHVRKELLPARIAWLQRAAAVPDSGLVVRGRWLMKKERWNEAIESLEEFVERHAEAGMASEARSLAHQARLGRALELANVENPKVDPAAALQVLEGITAEPHDFAVCAGKITEATIKLRQGSADEARRIMAAALKAYHARQTPPASPPTAGSLEADVLAIRDLLFRPKGDGIFSDSKWNAFSLPTQRAPYLVTNSDVPVRLTNGETVLVSCRHLVPGIENMLFLNPEQIRILDQMIVSLGGTRRRAPASVMAVPNQPAGPSLEVRAFWSEFFPAHPGHWSGWVFETYPILTKLRFLDDERTRAKVGVTIGSEGCTVVLEKVDGKWRATGIVSRWIT